MREWGATGGPGCDGSQEQGCTQAVDKEGVGVVVTNDKRSAFGRLRGECSVRAREATVEAMRGRRKHWEAPGSRAGFIPIAPCTLVDRSGRRVALHGLFARVPTPTTGS